MLRERGDNPSKARSELRREVGRYRLTGSQKGKALINFVSGNPGRQRENGDPAGGGRRESILGCGGLGCCGIEAACGAGAGAGGVDDVLCLPFSSAVRSAAMFWAICSCLAASCSTLRRTASSVDARGASCRVVSVEVAATGDFVVETDNSKPSVGTWATSISFASSP